MTFTWNPKTFSYYDEAGNRVSRAQVRSWIEKVANKAKENLASYTKEFREGEFTDQRYSEWVLAMRDEIKSLHLSSAMRAYGGRENMGNSEMGRTGARLREEYSYLNQMSLDVLNGIVEPDGRLDARAQMYGQAAYVTYEKSFRAMMQDAGAEEEQSVTNSDESCDECDAEEARGWQPVGEITGIGDRTCLSNCRCEMEYRDASGKLLGDDESSTGGGE